MLIFTCGWARNTSKVDSLVTFEVFSFRTLPGLELYRGGYLWGQKISAFIESPK